MKEKARHVSAPGKDKGDFPNCKTEFHPEHPFRGIYFFQTKGWSLVLQMYMMDIWLFLLRQNRSKHE